MTDDTAVVPAPRGYAEPLIPAAYGTDGTGWTKVNASPEWWRWAATSPRWPELAERFAQAGEEGINPRLCRAVGASTKRPCKFNISTEPCPHHGEGHEANRCGARTKKGTGCQWNLVVNGECPNHPHTWERIERARRAEEEAAQRARDAAVKAAEERRRAEEVAALEGECPYCHAEAGEQCQRRDRSAAGSVHTPRRRLGLHAQVAAVTACESCGAMEGSLCRTSSGKSALDPHAARRRDR
ncbi:hypothetical protein [Kitasatospora sp. NPDC050463]|uniref:zinc finger domain-containing protein n=1 Tax=Kitasatospora sp. NPDC050463 TaxID=3155786 RepID=UPI00340FF838